MSTLIVLSAKTVNLAEVISFASCNHSLQALHYYGKAITETLNPLNCSTCKRILSHQDCATKHGMHLYSAPLRQWKLLSIISDH